MERRTIIYQIARLQDREVWWWLGLLAGGHYRSGSLPWRLQFYFEPQL